MDITGELVTIIAQQNACSKWDDKNRKANTAEQKYSIASFHLNFSLTFTKINGQNVVFCNVVINIVYLNLNSIFNNLNAIMTKYRFWQMKTLHFGN